MSPSLAEPFRSFVRWAEAVGGVRFGPLRRTDCPDENTVAEFVGGVLDRDAARVVEGHLDGCTACRELVAELARTRDPCGGGPHDASCI